MGLHDEITAEIAEAFDTDLADAVQQFTGMRKGFGGEQGEYDPITDTYTSTTGATGDLAYSGRGVLGKFDDYEILSSQIDIFDVKLTALQAETTAKPLEDDVITVNGKARRVINMTNDPANVTWVLQLRGI